MINKIAVIAGIIIFFLLIIILITGTGQKLKNLPIFPKTASVTATALPSLTIVSTQPADRATNIGVEEKIIVTFNRKPEADEVSFSISPDVYYFMEIQENKLLAIPQEKYSAGTQYTFAVKYKNPPYTSKTYSFTTIGPTQTTLPDTYPSGAREIEENFQRLNHPDVFLSNKTPYKTNTFSVSSRFVSVPIGHYAFTVTAANVEQAKKEVQSWLKSLELTDTQIQTLDIEYP